MKAGGKSWGRDRLQGKNIPLFHSFFCHSNLAAELVPDGSAEGKALRRDMRPRHVAGAQGCWNAGNVWSGQDSCPSEQPSGTVFSPVQVAVLLLGASSSALPISTSFPPFFLSNSWRPQDFSSSHPGSRAPAPPTAPPEKVGTAVALWARSGRKLLRHSHSLWWLIDVYTESLSFLQNILALISGGRKAIKLLHFSKSLINALWQLDA